MLVAEHGVLISALQVPSVDHVPGGDMRKVQNNVTIHCKLFAMYMRPPMTHLNSNKWLFIHYFDGVLAYIPL